MVGSVVVALVVATRALLRVAGGGGLAVLLRVPAPAACAKPKKGTGSARKTTRAGVTKKKKVKGKIQVKNKVYTEKDHKYKSGQKVRE